VPEVFLTFAVRFDLYRQGKNLSVDVKRDVEMDVEMGIA